MSIYLGNLDVIDIERRAGVEFSDELRDYMKDRKQNAAANVAPDKWHCFDLPFVLVCGSMEVAETIYKHLEPVAKQFKEPMQISVNA